MYPSFDPFLDSTKEPAFYLRISVILYDTGYVLQGKHTSLVLDYASAGMRPRRLALENQRTQRLYY
jgi:hypothetical protein